MKTKDVAICGLAAVQSLFARQPDAIKRLYYDYGTARKAAKISSHLAKTKRIYRVVEPVELEKIANTIHHGGIVAIVEQRPLREPRLQDIQAWAAAKKPLVLLDRVGNAHNLGAIVRTAAFFGIQHMIVAGDPQQALPGEAAYRVAEGGMEHVEIFRAANLTEFCRALAAHYDVVATAVGPGTISFERYLAQRKPGRPWAVVLGNEEEGVAPAVAAACTHCVKITGTGRVESLNVSVAAAICFWALKTAQH